MAVPQPPVGFTITRDCFRRGVLRVGVVKQPTDRHVLVYETRIDFLDMVAQQFRFGTSE